MEGTASNVVSRYCAASETNDIDALMSTLAPDVELVSPLSAHMVFRGRDDARTLLSAVYGGFSELRWGEPIGEGSTRVAVSVGRVGGARLDDSMVFELDHNGLIRRIRPHLRPWFGITVFALLLGPKVARKPSIVLRALRKS